MAPCIGRSTPELGFLGSNLRWDVFFFSFSGVEPGISNDRWIEIPSCSICMENSKMYLQRPSTVVTDIDNLGIFDDRPTFSTGKKWGMKIRNVMRKYEVERSF